MTDLRSEGAGASARVARAAAARVYRRRGSLAADSQSITGLSRRTALSWSRNRFRPSMYQCDSSVAHWNGGRGGGRMHAHRAACYCRSRPRYRCFSFSATRQCWRASSAAGIQDQERVRHQGRPVAGHERTPVACRRSAGVDLSSRPGAISRWPQIRFAGIANRWQSVTQSQSAALRCQGVSASSPRLASPSSPLMPMDRRLVARPGNGFAGGIADLPAWYATRSGWRILDDSAGLLLGDQVVVARGAASVAEIGSSRRSRRRRSLRPCNA